MKFRLDDKVIVTKFDGSFPEKDYKNKVATVIMVDRIKQNYSFCWDYAVQFEDGRTYVYTGNELKLALKHQQLLFDFVK